MRLLAYGGTGYYERQRIGAWENAPRNALDDSFGLAEGQLTFGLCVIDQTSVLVIRRLQVTKTGRAYAYSLLLDPGASVWQRFAWDAAGLSDSLFSEAVGISSLLMEQPETLNAQDLQVVFNSLSPKADRLADESLTRVVNDSEAAWIGAFFTPEISSWPPQVFGFATRPSFAEMSVFLRRLPPCFRAGLGWLVGSSGQSARNFGAQFSLDERGDEDPVVADLIGQGRQLYEALQMLASDDDFAEAADRLRGTPVWQWAADAGENPAPLAQRLTIIAALLKAAPDRDDILRAAVESLPHTDFFAVELRLAWQRALFLRGQRLTSEQTSFALESYFDYGLPLLAANAALLDENRLVERFVTDGLDPASANIPLPLATRGSVWNALLRRTRESEDVPGIFFRAIADFEEEDQDGIYVASLTQELRERMTSDKSFSLLSWQQQHYRNQPHWPSVKQMLRELARERTLSRNPGWQLEYLLFAEDDGTDWLIHETIRATTKREWQDLISLFMSLVRTNQEYAEPARIWLQALAYSGVREMEGILDSEQKYLIGKTVQGSWISYVDLWNAYNNQVEVFIPVRSLSENDKRLLQKELNDLIQQKPIPDSVPDLTGLETLLGPLPRKTVTYFLGLSPNLSKPAEAIKLLSFLASRDSKLASKETRHIWLDLDGDLAYADYWLKPEFDEKEMVTLFSTLLFGETRNRGKRYQKRLRELLTKAQAQDAKGILKAVRRIFEDGIGIDAQARVFCQRFAEDRGTLDTLLKCLPKSSGGLALTDALYKFNATHLVKEACEVWRTVSVRTGVLTPYQYSLMYHLSKRKGTRDRVEGVIGDDYPGDVVKLRLAEILKRGIEQEIFADQFEDQEDLGDEFAETRQSRTVSVQLPGGRSFARRIKDFLGIGSSAQKPSSDQRPGNVLGLNSAGRNVPNEEGREDSDTRDRQN